MSPCKSQENLTVEAYVETVSQRFTTLQLHDLEPAKAMKDGTSEEDSDDIVPLRSLEISTVSARLLYSGLSI